jgi:hypothetical protein
MMYTIFIESTVQRTETYTTWSNTEMVVKDDSVIIRETLTLEKTTVSTYRKFTLIRNNFPLKIFVCVQEYTCRKCICILFFFGCIYYFCSCSCRCVFLMYYRSIADEYLQMGTVKHAPNSIKTRPI